MSSKTQTKWKLLSRQVARGLAATVFLASLIPVKASPIAYMLVGNEQNGASNTGSLGSEDLGAGAYTNIGSLSTALAGIGSTNNALFGGGGTNLYQINTSTAALTNLGASGFTYEGLGSTPTGGLYAIDNSSANVGLWSINPATGAGTLIGHTGLTLGTYVTLSNGSSTLYLTDQNVLYSINLTTGAATAIGTSLGTAAQLGNSVGLEFEAMLAAGGTLYASEIFPGSNAEYTINTTTGVATSVQGLGNGIPGFSDGLSQLYQGPGGGSSAPEPGTLILALVSFASLPILRRKLGNGPVAAGERG